MSSTRAYLRYVAFLTFVAAFGLYDPLLAVSPEYQCEFVCGVTADCEQECQADLFETTCGNYYDGVQGGWCDGSCGDSYCVAIDGENKGTCFADCGWCGDNVCSATEESGGGNYCEDDCGTTSPPGGGSGSCDTGLQNCSSDKVCHPSGTCIAYQPCGLSECCGDSLDCDPAHACVAKPDGQKVCSPW